MIRRSAAVVVLVALACVPPPPEQLAPVAVRSTRSRPEIVRIATRELTAAGFEIAASDTSAGSITAKRTREKRGNFDYITCKFAENSLAETNLVSTLTVTVAATGSGSASDVQINGAVLATYPGLEDSPLPRSESQSDCASTGAIEKKIAAAVAAGVP